MQIFSNTHTQMKENGKKKPEPRCPPRPEGKQRASLYGAGLALAPSPPHPQRGAGSICRTWGSQSTLPAPPLASQPLPCQGSGSAGRWSAQSGEGWDNIPEYLGGRICDQDESQQCQGASADPLRNLFPSLPSVTSQR